MKLIKVSLLFSCLVVSSVATGTERIIVAGNGLENLQMDIQDECPKDTICPNLWFRYVINVTGLVNYYSRKGELMIPVTMSEVNPSVEVGLLIYFC